MLIALPSYCCRTFLKARRKGSSLFVPFAPFRVLLLCSPHLSSWCVQHVKQPRTPSITDRLYTLPENERESSRVLERYRPGPPSALQSILIFCDQVFLRYFCTTSRESIDAFFLQHHQRAIARQPLREPLISITLPHHQIAPPLMRRLKAQGWFVEQNPVRFSGGSAWCCSLVRNAYDDKNTSPATPGCRVPAFGASASRL